MEFVLLTVLLAYPASACLGGYGRCCWPHSQQPCAGPVCSGSQSYRGYSVPAPQLPLSSSSGSSAGSVYAPIIGSGTGSYPDSRSGSYAAPALNAPGQYNVVPAAAPLYNSMGYDGQQSKSPPQQPYGGELHGVASQQQYKDVSAVDTPSAPLSPVGSQVSGRFPDVVERAADGALDLPAIAPAAPPSVQTGDGEAQEVEQRPLSTIHPQDVLAQQQNVLRRQRLFN